MANNFIEKYTWLVEFLLRNDGASFRDISESWEEVGHLNPEGRPMSRSSFNKLLKAIPNVLHISIVHSRDHKYRVDSYHGQLDHLLYSNVSLNAILDRDRKLEGRILFEREPMVRMKWLEDIAHAMSEGKKISLDYRKYGDRHSTRRTLSPYCLKMFRRRWYVLADDGGVEKTFALDDRMEGLKVLDESFMLPEGFDAAARFRDAYGITIGKEIQEVLIKTYGVESSYWRSAPFHSTQKEIETGDGYSVFSFRLYPDAPEFIHALLSHGSSIEVLKPASLRKRVAREMEETIRRYA